MTESPTRVSCKPLFQKLGILTMPSQYTLFLMMFLANNLYYYTVKSSIHEINTREKYNYINQCLTLHHTKEICTMQV
jgi:phage anti-repressor protein